VPAATLVSAADFSPAKCLPRASYVRLIGSMVRWNDRIRQRTCSEITLCGRVCCIGPCSNVLRYIYVYSNRLGHAMPRGRRSGYPTPQTAQLAQA
jgi:hypothetical protein